MSRENMKVAIIEPYLVDNSGQHKANFVSEFVVGFEKLGDNVDVYIPKQSQFKDPELIPLGLKEKSFDISMITF
jgi:hypothetical protein